MAPRAPTSHRPRGRVRGGNGHGRAAGSAREAGEELLHQRRVAGTRRAGGRHRRGRPLGDLHGLGLARHCALFRGALGVGSSEGVLTRTSPDTSVVCLRSRAALLGLDLARLRGGRQARGLGRRPGGIERLRPQALALELERQLLGLLEPGVQGSGVLRIQGPRLASDLQDRIGHGLLHQAVPDPFEDLLRGRRRTP